MAEQDNHHNVITKPGVLAFGESLPYPSDIMTFFQTETVIQVSCGSDHSAVVCESGRVYIFGNNQDEECSEVTAGPKLLDTLSTVRITQAACGHQFTLFLSDTGELYACGVNYQGQLGILDWNIVPIPVLVTGLPCIIKVVAGCWHTLVLTDSGEVWGAGDNESGQLGLGHTSTQSCFTQIPNLQEPIIDMSSCWHHTALITASRILLMAGCNACGQLGQSDFSNLYSFKSVLLPSTVAAVSCGWFCTVALTDDGTTWAWGDNKSGQLGTGNSFDRSTPTKMAGLTGQTISQVIAGCRQTALLTRDGDIFMCGGELGLRMEDLWTPTLVPKSPGLVVQQVAFAENYSLMFIVPKPDTGTTSRLQIGITEEVVQMESDITDLERNFMKSLECPVCLQIMSEPIHLCINGHSLCGSCRSDTHITVCPVCRGKFMAGRNIALESLSANMNLPCKDCLKRMSVCELNKHGEVCPHRKYVCPVQLHSCGWSGRPEKMLAHTSSAHPDQTWRDLPHLFVHSLSDGLVHTDLLSAHDQVFTLHRRYDQRTNEFQTALRYIGPPEKADEFVFKFKFIMDKVKDTYLRNVCADSESVEGMFLSPNRVAIKNQTLDLFLQQGCLVCQVAILKVGRSVLADQIEALLDINA